MDYLVRSSRSTPENRIPLLNLPAPADSLLVLKPMSKLPQKRADGSFQDPTYQLPLSHMGGLKLHKNDQSYKAIVGWISDYAKVVSGEYKSAAQLPADNWYPTQLVVRLKNTPVAWRVGEVTQLFLFRWDEPNNAWSEDALAFTQGTVTPRRMVNGALFLIGDEHTNNDQQSQDVRLPPGRYLVKVYFDGEGKIARDPTLLLSPSDYQGELEISSARWRPGFRFAQVVDGEGLLATTAE